MSDSFLPDGYEPPVVETTKPVSNLPDGFEISSPENKGYIGQLYEVAKTSPDPDEAIASVALAEKMAEHYKISVPESIQYLDSAVKDYFGKVIPKQTALQAIGNSVKGGYITNKIGILSGKMANEADEGKRAKLLEQIQLEEKGMPDVDIIKRGIPVQALKDAGELVGQMADPFIRRLGVEASLAPLNLIAPGISPIITRTAQTLAGGATTYFSSARVEQGLAYKSMIEQGISHDVASKYSMANGIISGALETAGVEVLLSNLPGIKDVLGKAIYKAAIKDSVAVAVGKTLAQSTGKAALGTLIAGAGETGTEVLQEIVNYKFEEIAKEVNNELYGTDIDPAKTGELLDRVKDVAVKTARGMAVLGIAGSAGSISMDTASNAQMAARQQAAKGKIAEGKKSEQKTKLDKLQAERDKIRTELETDPETSAKRLQLITKQIAKAQEDMQIAPDENLINLEAEKAIILEDIQAGKIDINTVRNLQAVQTAIDEMQMPEEAQKEKQPYQMTSAEYEASLQENITSAVEGIEQTSEVITSDRFRQKIKELTPDIKDNEVDAILTLHNLRAKAIGVDFEAYLNTQFSSEIAVQGDTIGGLPQGKKGAITFNNEAKALIILTQKSDFSTWIHESGHLFRRQLAGDLLTRAESYYGVSGSWTVPQEEAFTEDLTTYLMTGQAPTEQLRNVFQIISDALIAIYKSLANRGEISPEIKAVFDEMFQVESSIFFQAELYHGSPHSFDKFSTDAIGTGEGAQAFGWGLYYTEDEGIARGYAIKLSNQDEDAMSKITSLQIDIAYIENYLGENPIGKQDDLAVLLGIPPVTEEIIKEKKERLKELKKEVEILEQLLPKSRNLYTVTPAQKADFDEMTWLDWDKPISEKNEIKIENQFKKEFPQKEYYRVVSDATRGQVIYKYLTDEKIFLTDKEASLFLLRAGIDGIRYPANFMAGGNKDGKSNYVVFDENAVQIKEKILFQEELQIDTVRRQYAGTDKWMKAPNGAPTNLNERQWLQVRTDNFKKWFGDWENDPENASKVVDANGEPLVVYHGTGKNFNVFKETEKGLWFSPEYKAAENYALKRTNDFNKINIIAGFVDIKNPAEKQWIDPDKPDSDTWTDNTQRFDALGYDGWISKLKDGSIFTIVANKPNQIKSATGNSGKFDPENPSILFQSEQHKDAVRLAVEKGVYVPDNVLQEYISEEWAQEEFSNRQLYKQDSLLAKDGEEYVTMMSAFEDKPASYWKSIYESIVGDVFTPEQRNKSFLESLDKKTLESILLQIGQQGIKTNPPAFIDAAIKHVVLNGSIVKDEYYNKLMAQIRNDYTDRQLSFRKFIAEELGDTDELVRLEQERLQMPDETELEKLREENKKLRKEEKTYNQSLLELEETIKRYQNRLDYAARQGIYLNDALNEARIEAAAGEAALKTRAKQKAKVEKILTDFEKKQLVKELRDKHAEYKSALKTRALQQKYIRMILKKPPASCDALVRREIMEIQGRYVKTIGPSRLALIQDLILQKDSIIDEKVKAEIEKEINKQSLKAMDTESLRRLAEIITDLKYKGVENQKNKIIKQKIERAKVVNAILAELPDRKKIKMVGSIGSEEKTKGGLLSKIKTFSWDMKRLAPRLGGVANKWLVDKVNEANENYYNELNRRQDAFTSEMDRLKITVKDLAEKITIQDETITFNTAMGIYLATRNSNSLEALLYGNYKDNPDRAAFIDEVMKKLPQKMIAFADWMMESFSGEDQQRLFDAFTDDKNEIPEKVLNYFPMMRRDVSVESYQFTKEISDDLTSRTGFSKSYPWKKNLTSRIKIGKDHQTPIRLDAVNVYMSALQKQEHYINNYALVKDLQYIFNNKEIRDAIATNYGSNWNEAIQQYINGIANPSAFKSQLVHDNWFKKAISNSVVGALAFNVTSLMNQVPGVWLYAREAGFADLASSHFELLADYKKIKDFVFENDPQVRNRNIDQVLENIGLAINNPEAKARFIAEVQNVGLAGLKALDEMTVLIGWNAVYKKVYRKTGNHELAVKTAKETTLKTQPQGNVKDSPMMYNNETLRPFLVFTRATNQIWQMITADSVQYYKQGRFDAIVRDAIAIAMTGLFIGIISRKRLPEDDEEIIKDILSQFIVGAPLIGGAITAKVQGEWYADQGVRIPFVTVANQTYSTFEGLFDGDKDAEAKVKDAVRLTVEAMKLNGLPAVATWRAYKAIEDEDIRWLLIGGLPKE